MFLSVRRLPFLLTLVSALVIIAIMSRVPQSLFSDLAWILKPVQQFQDHQTPTINHSASPAPSDLMRDEYHWGYWWPGGPAAVVYLASSIAGLSLGAAVRLVAALALIVGSLGWVAWFQRFALPRWVLLGVAVMLPWMRYAHDPLFRFSAEPFVYAPTPWLLLATLHYVQQGRYRWLLAYGLGMLLGAVYLFKYSAILPSLGCALFVCGALLFKQAPSERRAGLLVCILLGLGMATSIIPLAVANRMLAGTANMLTASAKPGLRPESLLFAVSEPALMLADGEGLVQRTLYFPGGRFHFPGYVGALIGLPGGLLLLWLITHPFGRYELHERLAVTVFGTILVTICSIWLLSPQVSHEGRHVAAASLTILPFAIAQGFRSWRERGALWRPVLLAAGLLYVAIPYAYGATGLLIKALRIPRNATVGRAHFSNPLVADIDYQKVLAQITAGFDPAREIWFAPDPATAIDLPGRMIVRDADFASMAELKIAVCTSRPLGVWVLLPYILEDDPKGHAIRENFVQAGQWTRTEFPGSRYVLWRTSLDPAISCTPGL